MFLPGNVRAVRHGDDSYCEGVQAWFVRVWAKITQEGPLEICSFYERDALPLFLCLYGNAGERHEEILSGEYVSSGHPIPLEMLGAMDRLRAIFFQRRESLLQEAVSERQRWGLLERAVLDLASRYLVKAEAVVIELPADLRLEENSRSEGLTFEEFIVERFFSPSGAQRKPETLVSKKMDRRSYSIVSGSGLFIVGAVEMPNGKRNFKIRPLIKEDELKVKELLKGDE